jgi:multiple sugar transport system permease protein
LRARLNRLAGFLDRNLGILFLLPGFLVLVMILAYPIVTNIWLSLTDAHLVYPGASFVGLRNFAELLRSTWFHDAARRSVIWTVGSILLQLAFGMIAALLLNRPTRYAGVYRTFLIIPYTFPSVTVAFIWRYMLNGLYGVSNYILLQLGVIKQPVSWLGNPNTALGTLVLINVWFGFPLFALAILAGLKAIPDEHYELAAIEGASRLQTFRLVTLPGIRTIVGIMVVLRTIWIFNAFDLVWLLTGGGPGRSSETLPVFAYIIGWRQYYLGETAAVAVLLFGFLGVMSVLYFRLLRIETRAEGI